MYSYTLKGILSIYRNFFIKPIEEMSVFALLDFEEPQLFD